MLIAFPVNRRAHTSFPQAFTPTQGTHGCGGTVMQLIAQLPPGSIPAPPTCVGFLKVFHFPPTDQKHTLKADCLNGVCDDG